MGERPVERRGAHGAGFAVLLVALMVGCGGGDDDPIVARPVAPPTVSATPHSAASAAHRRQAQRGRQAAVRQPASDEAVSGGAVLSAADVASFSRLERSLGGSHGVAVAAVGSGGAVQSAGTLATGIAWSTSKVPIAMAVIAAGAGPRHQADLDAAITESDNGAARRLWDALGGGQAAAHAADAQLRRAGDFRTRMESRDLRPPFTAFGQTLWALGDQARFTAGMACTAAGAQVLGLMAKVSGAQRWGLGAAGVPAQLKGGWGPGLQPGAPGGYLDRQMGVLTIGGRPLAVAIASLPADGSHVTGARELTEIARWLVAHANVHRLPTQAQCA